MLWGKDQLRGLSLRAVLCKTALWSAAYNLWKLRDSATCQGRIKSEETIIRTIKQEVKNQGRKQGLFLQFCFEQSAVLLSGHLSSEPQKFSLLLALCLVFYSPCCMNLCLCAAGCPSKICEVFSVLTCCNIFFEI